MIKLISSAACPFSWNLPPCVAPLSGEDMPLLLSLSLLLPMEAESPLSLLWRPRRRLLCLFPSADCQLRLLEPLSFQKCYETWNQQKAITNSAGINYPGIVRPKRSTITSSAVFDLCLSNAFDSCLRSRYIMFLTIKMQWKFVYRRNASDSKRLLCSASRSITKARCCWVFHSKA